MQELQDSLFVRACRQQSVERTPVWVMRQAGRYLPEYRALREQMSFLELCRSPEAAAEATFQPIRRYQLDAAIIFSDILIPVQAMGVGLDYTPGPVLDRTVSSLADVERLRVPDPERDMPFVAEACRVFVRGMPKTPLIGFAGAPFTLLAYLVEGGGSKNYAKTKAFLCREPKAAHQLLERLADTVAAHLIMQLNAGCAAAQVFDSWAGYLSPDDFLRFSLPYLKRITDQVKAAVDAPVILFAKGANACLEELSDVGADVLGVDWTLRLDEAGRRTRGKVALQGNLDPARLLGDRDQLEAEVRRVLAEAHDLGGHIFNLGHGIMPMTDPEMMGALVDCVKRFGIKEKANG